MQRKHNSKLTPLAKQLRKNMTKEERHLWYDFQKSYEPRFLRQKIIGNYIADFYCAKAKLVIEADGSQHYENNEMMKDISRTSEIEKFGLFVLRIPNNEIMKNFEGVCEYIDMTVKKLMKQG